MKSASILFVCLGNICRSPAAEAVMQHLVDAQGLSHKVLLDSAGTAGWHQGKPADRRMREAAEGRGYDVTSISRRVSYPEDFEQFDLLIAMDPQNLRDLRDLDLREEHGEKLALMTDFCSRLEADHVPDPYYGGVEGFEQVLDILEDACAGLLAKLQSQES